MFFSRVVLCNDKNMFDTFSDKISICLVIFFYMYTYTFSLYSNLLSFLKFILKTGNSLWILKKGKILSTSTTSPTTMNKIKIWKEIVLLYIYMGFYDYTLYILYYNITILHNNDRVTSQLNTITHHTVTLSHCHTVTAPVCPSQTWL